MITIVATPGAATANSYVTLAEATSYFEAYPEFPWLSLSDETKKAWLVRSARSLNRFQFIGHRCTDAQALEFPRSVGPTRNPILLLNAEIVPQEVKSAQCEMIMLLYNRMDQTSGNYNRETISVNVPGTVAVDFEARSPAMDRFFTSNTSAIAMILRDWISGSNSFKITK